MTTIKRMIPTRLKSGMHVNGVIKVTHFKNGFREIESYKSWWV